MRAPQRRLAPLLLACLAVAVSGLVTASPAGATTGGPQGFTAAVATRVTTVDARMLNGSRSTQQGAGRQPFRGVATAGSRRSPRTTGIVTDASTAGQAATSTTAALTEDSQFPVMSLDQQISALGSGQNVTPPDSQLAAGPQYLLEALNDSGSVWTKSGAPVETFDLDVFFSVPAGSYFSDPRAFYDAPTGRWFLSGLSFTPPSYGSAVYLAVSSTSDPTGLWTVYTADPTANVLHDQPKIGVSADKVVMSWNDFQNASSFIGETTYVWQKSDLLSASSSVAVEGVVDDSSRASLVPAQSLGYFSTDTNAFIVYNNNLCFFCTPSIGVLTVTGTPAQNTVAWTESDPAIAATSNPPSADQPGAPGSIATNDDRLLTALVQAGTLWTSGNDACVPGGDTTARPCARMIALSTANDSVTQDFDFGTAGVDVYYPAVGLDSAGDMLATYSISSTSLYPSVRVIGEAGGSTLPGQTVVTGQALYNDVPCYPGTSQPSRWGDYSAAAVDPSSPGDVWLTGEFAATSTLPATSGCAWATYTAEVSVGTTSPAPIASVTPTSIGFGNQRVGTQSSAQTVTVTNTGTANLIIAAGGVTLSDTTDFLLSADTCSGSSPTTVAPGGSCTFGVSFSPATVGSFSAVIDISDNAIGSPQTVSLTGSGVKRHH